MAPLKRAEWTAEEDAKLRRWHNMGKLPGEMSLFLDPKRHPINDVSDRLDYLGLRVVLLSEREAAAANLKREVALGREEIRRGTAAPYKGEIAWPE